VDPATAASLLGVSVDASRADIERAFRRRARVEHPDVSGDPSAFAAVTAARDVLVRAAGWETPPVGPTAGRHRVTAAPRRGFELPLVAVVLLSIVVAIGCLVAGVASTSPYAPIEPVLRSVLLVGSVAGYALTRRRVLGIVSAIAILVTGAATVAWVSFGALLGAALMAPAVVLLMLHGRNRAL
jgi:hypothetical protein